MCAGICLSCHQLSPNVVLVCLQGVRKRARVPQLVMLWRRQAHLHNFNTLLGAQVALMEQLQAIVLAENAHNTATSGLFEKNLRSQILVPSP